MELNLDEFPTHIVLATIHRLQRYVRLVNHPLDVTLQLLLYIRTFALLAPHPHQLGKLQRLGLSLGQLLRHLLGLRGVNVLEGRGKRGFLLDDLEDVWFCPKGYVVYVTTPYFIPLIEFGIFLIPKVWLDLIPLQELLKIILVILPIVEIVIAIEVQLLVLGLVFLEGRVVNHLKGLRLVLQALNDVILFLEEHIEFLKFLVD